MRGSGDAQPPLGWLLLLRKHSEYATGDLRPEQAEAKYRSAIDTLHQDWKRRFRYRKDWPSRRWEPARLSKGPVGGRVIAEGNCNSWCLLLQRELAAIGVPRGSLRICTCKLGQRDQHAGHTVLAVEMSACTLISDSLMTCVMPWTMGVFKHYAWLARQVPGQRFWWESLRPPVTLGQILGRVP